MRKLILYIVLFFAFSSIYGQVESIEIAVDSTIIVQKKFDETNLNKYRNDKDFNYSAIEETASLYDQILDWFNRLFRKISSWFFDDVEIPVGFLMTFLKLLPYIIAVVVLYLIINFFLKINSRNILNGKTNKEIVHIEDDEELLNSKDLPSLISKAIVAKNYRLAIRYQYVLLLQQLSNKELIVWEQQKTNKDYIKEVKSKNIHTEFEEITRFYDFVWYGNFEINYEEYLKGIESIQKIEHTIK